MKNCIKKIIKIFSERSAVLPTNSEKRAFLRHFGVKKRDSCYNAHIAFLPPLDVEFSALSNGVFVFIICRLLHSATYTFAIGGFVANCNFQVPVISTRLIFFSNHRGLVMPSYK